MRCVKPAGVGFAFGANAPFVSRGHFADRVGDRLASQVRPDWRGRGQLTLHLPEGWHRQAEWTSLFDAGCGPPARAA